MVSQLILITLIGLLVSQYVRVLIRIGSETYLRPYKTKREFYLDLLPFWFIIQGIVNKIIYIIDEIKGLT